MEDKYYNKIKQLEKEINELKARLRKYEKVKFNSGKFVVKTRELHFGKPTKYGLIYFFLWSKKDVEAYAEALERTKARKGFADSEILTIEPQPDPSLCEHKFESDHYGNDNYDYYTCCYCGEHESRPR